MPGCWRSEICQRRFSPTLARRDEPAGEEGRGFAASFGREGLGWASRRFGTGMSRMACLPAISREDHARRHNRSAS